MRRNYCRREAGGVGGGHSCPPPLTLILTLPPFTRRAARSNSNSHPHPRGWPVQAWLERGLSAASASSVSGEHQSTPAYALSTAIRSLPRHSPPLHSVESWRVARSKSNSHPHSRGWPVQ